MGKVIDLTGDRYGNLTVINRGEDRYTKSNRKIITWICKCDCGNTIQVDSNNLRTGNTTSCGCKTTCIDLTGHKFGNLTVICRAGNNTRQDAMWLCRCDCGNEKVIKGGSLRSGATNSCGCGMIKGLEKGWEYKKHGLTKTRIYGIWANIKKRTSESATGKSRKDYYDRGIRMCEEWKDDFMSFYKWSMENGYRDDLTIDRKDNNGNYEPSNCRWTSDIEQARNRRSNLNIEYNGEIHTLKEWSEILDFEYEVVRERIQRYGWSIKRAFETPKREW